MKRSREEELWGTPDLNSEAWIAQYFENGSENGSKYVKTETEIESGNNFELRKASDFNQSDKNDASFFQTFLEQEKQDTFQQQCNL